MSPELSEQEVEELTESIREFFIYRNYCIRRNRIILFAVILIILAIWILT